MTKPPKRRARGHERRPSHPQPACHAASLPAPTERWTAAEQREELIARLESTSQARLAVYLRVWGEADHTVDELDQRELAERVLVVLSEQGYVRPSVAAGVDAVLPADDAEEAALWKRACELLDDFDELRLEMDEWDELRLVLDRLGYTVTDTMEDDP